MSINGKYPMRHVVVVLPGIMGSALQKDGKDVWALSGEALWHYLRRWGRSLNELAIVDDDWQQDDLGDGVSAARLIENIHSVPGLIEHAGYGPIRRSIKDFFDVTEGSIHAPQPDQNFFTFPYDWRRDNRNSARRLQQFVDRQLPAWREWSGAADAQVVLLAHSMGGLVARYYVEVLGGWRDCRALITFGTPHRGSVNALNTLSNGYKQLFLNLSTVVRSMTSVYQLLPTYPVIKLTGSYCRVGETGEIPGVDLGRATAARDTFHEVIRGAAGANARDPSYHQPTIPWVGTRQDTLQSALLDEGRLVLSYHPPANLDPTLADGDGTVPRVSAIPPDLDGQPFARYAIERHGWLTNTEMALQPVLDTLVQLVASGSRELYGEVDTVRPAINLRLDPLYLSGEALTLRLGLLGTDRSIPMEVQVDAVDQPAAAVVEQVILDPGDARMVQLSGLAPGLYRLEARPTINAINAPTPVHGIFEVAGLAVTEEG